MGAYLLRRTLGGLLTAIISFFAVAIVVYLVFVYPMNRWKAIAAARATGARIAAIEATVASIRWN